MLNDGLFLKGSSGFFNALLEPLAAIALLWMMLLLPTRLAQMAMLGAELGPRRVHVARGQLCGRIAGARRRPPAPPELGRRRAQSRAISAPARPTHGSGPG